MISQTTDARVLSETSPSFLPLRPGPDCIHNPNPDVPPPPPLPPNPHWRRFPCLCGSPLIPKSQSQRLRPGGFASQGERSLSFVARSGRDLFSSQHANANRMAPRFQSFNVSIPLRRWRRCASRSSDWKPAPVVRHAERSPPSLHLKESWITSAV